MAMVLNFACKSNEDARVLQEKVHRGLRGSIGYRHDEVILCELEDNKFSVIVGENNSSDLAIDVSVEDFHSLF